MVAKGSGTDGWHRQLADSRRLRTLFLGSGRAEQASAWRPSPDDHFPLPPGSECQHGSRRSGKGHGGSRSQGAFALLLISSAAPASPSSSPSPQATGTIPRANPSRPRDSDRAQPRLPERENRGMLALEPLSVRSHGSWTCCLPDPFTPLPDI